MTDENDRAAAALAALLACGELGATAIGIAESLADNGALDLDDLRLRELLEPHEPSSQLLVSALPFGLATPLDRPRLRRDAYRFAAAAGADEGTALACVAAALVAADLTRFDASMTAIRVRQSLLEDAPMALLARFQLLDAGAPRTDSGDDDGGGGILQLALSATSWHDGEGVAATLAALGDAGPVASALAGTFAAIRAGACDAPLDPASAARAADLAGRLSSLRASPA